MPITYAQPEPFAPGISSSYGSAQQFSQDAPAIINATSQAAQLQAQNARAADQLRLAYAEANARSQDERARLYTQSDMANADRQQSALNLGAQITEQGDTAMLGANTAMLRDQQQANVQNWLMGQELSQKEAMRLQQMQSAVGDIQASSLSPDEKTAAITQLKTGIDVYKQRQQVAQTKMTEMQAQHMENTVKRAKAIELENRALEAQFASEGKDVRRWADPETGKTHLLIKNDKTGEWYNPLQASGTRDSEMQQQELELKRYDLEMKHYQDAMEKAIARVDKINTSKNLIGEKAPPREQVMADALADLEARGLKPPTLPQRGSRSNPSAQPGQQVAPPSQAPAPGGPIAERVKQAPMEIATQQMMALAQAPNIPEPVKQQAAFAIREAAKMIQVAGSYDNLTPAEKKRYDSLQRAYRSLDVPNLVPAVMTDFTPTQPQTLPWNPTQPPSFQQLLRRRGPAVPQIQ